MSIQLVCKTCGTSYETYPCLATRRKFCSRYCRDHATPKRIEKTCCLCQKKYKVILSKRDRSKFCSSSCHYQFFRKNMVVSFWEKVDKRGPKECWPWTAACSEAGYGRLGKNIKAHRFSYELAYGRLAPGECVLHACDNPPCVNPNPGHLFKGTLKDNSQDAARKGRLWIQNPQNVLTLSGENASGAKLTNKQAQEIRSLRGQVSRQKLAVQYGVHKQSISRIQRGRTFKNLL